MAARVQQRVEQAEELLAADVIDIKALRQFAHGGIPDQPGLRSKVWKLLLDYLPLQKDKWQDALDKQRKAYEGFLTDFIKSSHDLDDDDSDPLGAVSGSKPDADKSSWDAFFKENEILYQIDMDVKRLAPEFVFFQRPTGRPRPIDTPLHTRIAREVAESATFAADRDGVVSARRKRGATSSSSSPPPPPIDPPPADGECHWEVVERILFIYALLNRGAFQQEDQTQHHHYVQGMNEILGPLYFVFASDPDPEWREHAEADTFFCFTALMGHIRGVFDRTGDRDTTGTGVAGVLLRFEQLLQRQKPSVLQALKDMNLEMQFFAFRWITLLLSQEFRVPDVIRLWDSLFASRDLLQRLLYICVAMLEHVGDTLEERDFATCMKLLQNFPETVDVAAIVAASDKIAQQEEHLKRHKQFMQSGDVR